MPTGTGKTDTMVAALIAQRITRLLVLVPSDALRDQLVGKFERLGVLPELGLVTIAARRPVVGKLVGALADRADAERLADTCNVVVSTPNAIRLAPSDVRTSFLKRFDYLFIDEAHHVSAPTWRQLRDEFAPKPIVQFTATPHRADGQHLGGTLLYVFPLREAQRQGYFSKIRYKSVLSLLEPDKAIADEALSTLREDLSDGRDHILMARANSIRHAEEIQKIYVNLAPELNPRLIHHQLSKTDQQEALDLLARRDSRVLICVDMLGEGFDFPQLKIAALHDQHHSLGITLQFIGRFARGGVEGLGDATVIAARSEIRYNEDLRRLYAEDADWNRIVEDLSAAAIEEQVQIDEFTRAFNSLPDEVPIHSLTPAMSAVVFKPAAVNWHPEAITTVIPRDQLVTFPIPVNSRDGITWFVTRTRGEPRWGSIPNVEAVNCDLFVIYWNASTGLLYINSSNKDSVHEELARAISGDPETVPIKGDQVYRVFHEVQRLTPTNIGLLDARNRSRRFTNHVGSDVTEAFPVAEAQTKTQTHIAGTGYLHGSRYTVAGSLKGRIWSQRTAMGLKQWADWCDVVGPKLIDSSISVDEIMAGFIRPIDLDTWPNLRALAIELSGTLTDTLEGADLKYAGATVPFHEVEIEITAQANGSDLPIALVSPEWRADYTLELTQAGLHLQPTQASKGEVEVVRPRSQINFSSIAIKQGLRVLMANDSVVEVPGVLLKPNRDLPPFPVERLTALDWTGVNIRKESWGFDRDPATVQGRMMKQVLADEWDVVLDDDGPGEAADIVAIRAIDETLRVMLVHCKFSSEDAPGARVADLYELAGQAERSAGWRRNIDTLFRHLMRRERARAIAKRTGFVKGSIEDLQRLFELAVGLTPRLTIALAQPGLSAAAVGANQLELLSSVDLYVAETANSSIRVFCSA